MKRLIDVAEVLVVVISWLAGIALAKGFTATTVAVCFPPYAWYLVVERAMVMSGLV